MVSYCALVALWATLRTQQRHWEYLQRKEKKEEWRDAIRDADRALLQDLDRPIPLLSGSTATREQILHTVARRDILTSGKCYDAEYADTVFAKYTALLNVEAFKGTGALVIDIWNLLDGFSDNLTEQDSRLLSFYISYFQGVTTDLHLIGAISDNYFQHGFGKLIAKLLSKTHISSARNNQKMRDRFGSATAEGRS